MKTWLQQTDLDEQDAMKMKLTQLLQVEEMSSEPFTIIKTRDSKIVPFPNGSASPTMNESAGSFQKQFAWASHWSYCILGGIWTDFFKNR